MGNSIGKLFTIMSFGESHGSCIGVIIDGCPAGLPMTVGEIQKEVDRRKPEERGGGTRRIEEDKVEILSGIFNGFTTGAPICLLTRNINIDSQEYERIKNIPRPGHADYTAFLKYGGYNDFRGGGRFSGRITVAFVMAGAISKKILSLIGIDIIAHTVQIGGIKARENNYETIKKNYMLNSLKCADVRAIKKMEDLIEQVRLEKDSIGGIVEALAVNVPGGLGEPVFDTLEGELAKAFFSIPAVKGVEFGSGFLAAEKKGSENNDQYIVRSKKVVSLSNKSGGILGGISNGMPIVARIAIKPTASIAQLQQSVDLLKMENTKISVKGRHDVCIVPRAVPVIEAMMANTLCDFSLRAGLLERVIK